MSHLNDTDIIVLKPLILLKKSEIFSEKVYREPKSAEIFESGGSWLWRKCIGLLAVLNSNFSQITFVSLRGSI